MEVKWRRAMFKFNKPRPGMSSTSSSLDSLPDSSSDLRTRSGCRRRPAFFISSESHSTRPFKCSEGGEDHTAKFPDSFADAQLGALWPLVEFWIDVETAGHTNVINALLFLMLHDAIEKKKEFEEGNML